MNHAVISIQFIYINRYALPAYDVVLKSADSNTISVDRMRSVFTLTKYQRVVQVKDIPSTLYPVLLQVMMHSVPQAVEFQVKEVGVRIGVCLFNKMEVCDLGAE